MGKTKSDLTGTVICGLRHLGPSTHKRLTAYAACHNPTRISNALQILLKEGSIRKRADGKYEIVVGGS